LLFPSISTIIGVLSRRTVPKLLVVVFLCGVVLREVVPCIPCIILCCQSNYYSEQSDMAPNIVVINVYKRFFLFFYKKHVFNVFFIFPTFFLFKKRYTISQLV